MSSEKVGRLLQLNFFFLFLSLFLYWKKRENGRVSSGEIFPVSKKQNAFSLYD